MISISRTRMLGLSRDIVILWGSEMVACDGKRLKREYNTSVDYCEVCQSLWHFGTDKVDYVLVIKGEAVNNLLYRTMNKWMEKCTRLFYYENSR